MFHVMFEVGWFQWHAALGATYLHPITLPKSCSFSHLPPLVIFLTPLYPDETGHTKHVLSILKVFFYYQPTKHCNRQFQCILYPLVVPPRYPAIVGAKKQVPLPSRPSQAVLVFLGFADHINNRPHHHIHHNVEYYEVCRVALRYPPPPLSDRVSVKPLPPPPVWNAFPGNLPVFDTIIWRYQ